MAAMTFGDAVGEGIFNYSYFGQRAARAEYWWWVLFSIICTFGAIVLDSLIFAGWNGPQFWYVVGGPFYIVVALALFLPSLSVTVRRLHDTNKSGWWLLFPYGTMFIFFILAFNLIHQSILATTATVGGRAVNNATAFSLGVSANLFLAVGILMLIFFIILLVFMLLPGNPGNNKYGPNRYAGAGPDRYGAV